MTADKDALEKAYESGESSGYADWIFALNEVVGLDVDGPTDAANKIAALMARTIWQPIETAPKDGTLVLLFADEEISVGSNNTGSDVWRLYANGQEAYQEQIGLECEEYWQTSVSPTHWMPLPEPPKA